MRPVFSAMAASLSRASNLMTPIKTASKTKNAGKKHQRSHVADKFFCCHEKSLLDMHKRSVQHGAGEVKAMEM
jgi:hypothetical protein